MRKIKITALCFLLVLSISCKRDQEDNPLCHLAGTYDCIKHVSSYGPPPYTDTTYRETVEVKYAGKDQLELLSIVIPLDTSLCFSGFYYGPYHGISVCFLPPHDSISVYAMIGGLGAGNNITWNGRKNH